MSNIASLHCPLCGTKLKIKDRALFGQSVKCPGCKKPFILHDPNTPAPAPEPPAAVPPFGFSPASPPGAAGEIPQLFPGRKQMDFLSSLDAGAPAAAPQATPIPFPVPAAEEPVAAPFVPLPISATDEVSPLARIRKPRSKNRWMNLALFGVLGVAALGLLGYFAMLPKASPPSVTPDPAGGTPMAAAGTAPMRDSNQPYPKVLLETDSQLVAEFKPTQGRPIDTTMMPSGVNMVIHLHPALLWSDKYEYKVLRASLTDDVMSWLGQQIQQLTMREPAQIAELTVGVLLGARGTDPQFCAVVHLAQPEKLSNLIEQFPGKYLFDITQRPDLRIKVDDQRGYLIHDESTYAICPASMAGDLEFSVKTPNPDISVGMEALLQRTDRDRLFTVVTDVRDLDIHRKALLPPAAQPFLQALTDWLGEDVELLSWSVQPEPYFHSELALRPVSTKEVLRLQTDITSRLAELPQTVWKQLCAKMQPREMRFRQLIGRFPAMLEAFQESTVSQRENRCLLLTTVLPAKAAPNLALATLFTIDEASRTNFHVAAVAASQADKPKLPETVAERLKLPVDAEFNRTPLEQALTYLCGEIQVKLFVDGDALKDAGYTKNMPQTFNLGKVPMQRALFEIVNAYQEAGKEMVISVDEKSKTITVLTRKFAESKGLPVYPLKAQ